MLDVNSVATHQLKSVYCIFDDLVLQPANMRLRLRLAVANPIRSVFTGKKLVVVKF